MKTQFFIYMFIFATAILMTSCDKEPLDPPGSTTIDSEGEELRTVDYLLNYPDPFTSSTTFEYRVLRQTYVSLIILNSDDERVMILEKGPKEEGIHTVEFDASTLPSGKYTAQLRARDTEILEKVIKMKNDE